MTALSTEKKQLLSTLSSSWPAKHQIKIDGGEIIDLSSHVLAEEIDSAINDRKCCLPYFVRNKSEIAWFNTAQDADDLQSTIQALRCWFIPSYGWEDEQGWIVTDEANATGIRKQISDMSPAGYCRWRSRESDFETIAKKLVQLRFLEKAKPDLPPNGPPPLIQIRQEFVTALVACDRTSAENAIRLIETHQLDSADNSLFMWIRLWFTFKEFDRITKHKDIHRLTQLRIPKVIQQCILRSFYFSILEDFDWDNETDNILTAYKLDVHDVIGSLIYRSQNNEGLEILSLRACYAITNNDPLFAKEIAECTQNKELNARLQAIAKGAPKDPELTTEDQFWRARHQKDWGRLQELGDKLLSQDADIYAPLLKQSLEFHPNIELEIKLQRIEPNTNETGLTPQEEILSLIAMGESGTLEFKSTARYDVQVAETLKKLPEKKKPPKEKQDEILNAKDKERQADILKAVSALLNSKGGDLLIGVDDEGVGVGIHHDYKFLGKKGDRDGYELWLNSLFVDKFEKTCTGCLEITFAEHEGVDVCRISIEPSPEPAFVEVEGVKTFYHRLGNATHKLDISEFPKYYNKRFDNKPPPKRQKPVLLRIEKKQISSVSENQDIATTPPQALPTKKPKSRVILNSWEQWLKAITKNTDADFQRFFNERPELLIDQVEPKTITEISNHLEELYVATDQSKDKTKKHLLLQGLPELMQDFVTESGFPRHSLVPIYNNLFRLWGAIKCGSSHLPDSQVLLYLADGILSFDRDMESEIVGQFETWWNKSPVKALLPFLLGAIDLLSTKGTEEQCGNFWITGVTYLQNNPRYLTAGERKRWRQIGLQIFDSDTIEEYLPIPPEVTEEDPVQTAQLNKVAIVSMRETQAKIAADMIRERSNAEVVVVTKKAAGAQTDSAVTADVVLFVWKETSHAVFRAFDNMNKNKLSYVQGTGANSILLALERWIADNHTTQSSVA